MRTGRLSISRGHELTAERFAPGVRGPQEPHPKPVSFSPSNDHGALHLVQVRLNALERLTRLVEQGAISVEEFKLEKSLILRLTGEELLLTQTAPELAPAARERGPSLLGRLVSWPGLVLAAAAGLTVSFAVQPDETLAFFTEGVRLLGS